MVLNKFPVLFLGQSLRGAPRLRDFFRNGRPKVHLELKKKKKSRCICVEYNRKTWRDHLKRKLVLLSCLDGLFTIFVQTGLGCDLDQFLYGRVRSPMPKTADAGAMVRIRVEADGKGDTRSWYPSAPPPPLDYESVGMINATYMVSNLMLKLPGLYLPVFQSPIQVSSSRIHTNTQMILKYSPLDIQPFRSLGEAGGASSTVHVLHHLISTPGKPGVFPPTLSTCKSETRECKVKRGGFTIGEILGRGCLHCEKVLSSQEM